MGATNSRNNGQGVLWAAPILQASYRLGNRDILIGLLTQTRGDDLPCGNDFQKKPKLINILWPLYQCQACSWQLYWTGAGDQPLAACGRVLGLLQDLQGRESLSVLLGETTELFESEMHALRPRPALRGKSSALRASSCQWRPFCLHCPLPILWPRNTRKVKVKEVCQKAERNN